MTSFDRRASDRRGIASSSSISLGAVLADERREQRDRRAQPRRLSDAATIAHVARRIGAGQTHIDVIVDGVDGMRLCATFACGCSATEAIGAGPGTVHIDSCREHLEPPVEIERRRIRHQR
jgi:hypothetical protein